MLTTRHVLFLLPFISLPALAAPAGIEGSIDDASIRRKVDLVYVETVAGSPPSTGKAVIDQKGNTYLPHVLPVVVGTTVTFHSFDPELHNVFARGSKRVLFNQAVLPQMHFDQTFKELGVVQLTCNIHKEMRAYVVVLQNPYFAIPDNKTGKFTLPAGLPAGTYTARIWGEKLSDEEKAKTFQITVGGGSTAPALHLAAR